MTLVKLTSVEAVFRAQVERLTVSVNSNGETTNLVVTHADGNVTPLSALSSTTAQLSRDNLKLALEANFEISSRYNMADVSTDAVSMTQKLPNGPFTVSPTSSGSHVVAETTTTTAEHTLRRFKLNLKSPVAATTGAIYVARDTLRKCSGEFALVADADTNTLTPSMLVEDTNNLLEPTVGPSAASESSGYIDNGLTTAKNGPDWVKAWILNKEEIEIGDPVATRVLDSSYTVLSSDKAIFLTSTTSAQGDYTITFGTGVDGQLVTLMLDAIADDDEFIIAGVEDVSASIFLGVAGDSMTVSYDATSDKWRVVSSSINGVRNTAEDAAVTVRHTDRVIFLKGDGANSITFVEGIDGQEVMIILVSGSGNYNCNGLGVVTDLTAVKDNVLARYSAVEDSWYIIASTLT